MADFAKLCRHKNLDVEYYRFDYQFYNRIQLGNFLVVSYKSFSGLEGSQAGLPTVPSAFQHLHRQDSVRN